jgi:hypothetical protein
VVEARHAITFRRIRVEGYRARLEGDVPGDPERFRWAGPDDIASIPMSSLSRKLLRGLGGRQLPFPFA